ncbi:L-aspartate oxidase [Rhodococcoides corynebacterioides]|uniref:L-aspartate oxidase n=1 Tax=Rhodococcoides corynebacterioides TaxID=53972 RepID=UPI000A75C7F0|nr:L-aspartate oxidase [Rhodococcus corynebacterioides]
MTLTGSWDAAADLVVVGAGVAGLTAATEAVRLGLRVLVVAKDAVDTSTRYAQGGMATATIDDVAAHAEDTVVAGAGLCDPEAVRSVVGDGAAAFAALTALGARFDASADGGVARTREGGHRTARIVHAGGDATGAEIQRVLTAAGPTALTDAVVLSVITGPRGAAGVVVATADPGGALESVGVIRAPAVLLATGGSSMLFATGTNPTGATGDGIALALAAGAEIADVEFVQFHPTVFFAPGGHGRLPLISEALRGEGASLIDQGGRPVVGDAHPLGDLAPRDVVSRAIAARLSDTGATHVLLDARGVPDVARRFPTVTRSCRERGIDPATTPIPVAPAAHYACGGIVTDLAGRTRVPGLFAAGEVARTGLHGANRLASNSLLEGVVLGRRVAAAARERFGTDPTGDPVVPRVARRLDRAVLQAAASAGIGVVRDAAGIDAVRRVAAGAVDRPLTTVRDVEDSALTTLLDATVTAAALRTETRGAHTRRDHPDADPAQCRSLVLSRDDDGALSVRLGDLARRPVPAGVS